MLIAAGDKPPAIGVHLYRSTDGGDSWAEITDTVFSTPECAEVCLLNSRMRDCGCCLRFCCLLLWGAALPYHCNVPQSSFHTMPCCAVQAKGSRTPVPFFHGSQALVGTDGGHLLASDDPDRQQWRLMCRLPHPVTCMVALGQSCSSVMH